MAVARALTALLSLALLAAGCQRADAESLTRLPVPKPPAVQGTKPVLWVSLAAHLGSQPLALEGASAPLQLVDARGERFSARRVQLRWVAQALAEVVAQHRVLSNHGFHCKAHATAFHDFAQLDENMHSSCCEPEVLPTD